MLLRVFAKSLPALPASVLLAGKIVAAALIVAGSFFGTLHAIDAVTAMRIVEPAPVWDEKLYLALNPDVAAGVKHGNDYKSGHEHYIVRGKAEGRNSGYVPSAWNETGYLKANPDIADLVKQGKVLSGYFQYLAGGNKEGRKGGFPNT